MAVAQLLEGSGKTSMKAMRHPQLSHSCVQSVHRIRYANLFVQKEISRPTESKQKPNVLKQPPQGVKTYSLRPQYQISSEDRFIRFKYNSDASSYLLKKKNPTPLKKYEIDVFKQVTSLPHKWRKKFMHQLMVKENVIPGVGQTQVLRASHLSLENKLPGNLAGQSKELLSEEYIEDGMWKSKARRRPLIGVLDSILDMPGFYTLPTYRLRVIDWSSKDVIAAAIHDTVTFYDNCASEVREPHESVMVVNVCALKWDNAGERVAICTLASELKLYSPVKNKTLWTTTCASLETHYTPCYARCVCWSYSDRHVVTGCIGLITVYSAESGTVVNSTVAHTKHLLALEFSPNFQYLVSSAMDLTVCIFYWPTLTAILNVSYYEPVKALAWHPHESGLLCIGGGMGDASLSLWNVNKLNPVSYRHVRFHGSVEHLCWNKHSGELVVHWLYWKGRNQYTMIAVLASLDRIVDVVPLEKEMLVYNVMWNSDQTQLAVQRHQCLATWNFFGSEYQYRKRCKKIRKIREIRNGPKDVTFREFSYFNIR